MKEVKKVIQVNDDYTMSVDQCDTDMIYASLVPDDGHIIVVTQLEENKFVTNWLYPDRMICGHLYSSDSLSDILEQMLNDDYEVFALDGEEELADWIKEVF
jgi:hypothetical protein